MALDQRPLAVQAGGLAMGDADTADFEPGGFGEEVPEGFAGFLDGHPMQVEAAFESDLTLLELAHLAFLHAIAGPVELVFRADVDHELV
ncbi:hypothetical protein D3C80_1614040 [compost metagenome]